MNARVAKTRIRSSRVKLPEASQDQLQDAVAREIAGIHVVHNALSRRPSRSINSSLQDRQTVGDNNLQIEILLGSRRQCILGKGKATLRWRLFRCLQKRLA